MNLAEVSYRTLAQKLNALKEMVRAVKSCQGDGKEVSGNIEIVQFAQEWLDFGFSAAQANYFWSLGVFNPSLAQELRSDGAVKFHILEENRNISESFGKEEISIEELKTKIHQVWYKFALDNRK